MVVNVQRSPIRWHSSLQLRLILQGLLFAIIPISAVGMLVFFQAREQVRQQFATSTYESAFVAADDIGRFLQSRLGDVRVLAATPLLHSAQVAPSAKADYLRQVQAAYGTYEAIYLTDTQGNVLAATNGTIGDQTSLAWYKPAADGQVFMSSVYFLPSVQNLVITISAPVIDESRTFVGVVAAHIAAESLFGLVAVRRVGEGGEINVIDTAGRVVIDEHVENVFQDVSTADYFRSASAGRTQSVIAFDPEFGIEQLYAFAPITRDIENWIAVAKVPVTEVDAATNVLATRTIFVGILSALLASVISLFTTTTLTRPIRHLSLAADQIRAGQYATQLPPATMERKDELGALATSVQAMSNAIQSRDSDLRDLNRSLEGRVEQRTAALQKANDELKVATYRAKEAARVKGEFLANVSHELRTPLNAIIGFSDMLLMGMQGDLNEKQRHKMTRLRDNGTRLLTLINDLLDLTRIEAGRLEVAHNAFSPRHFAEKVVAQMEGMASQTGLKTQVVIAPNLPTTLMGDEARLEQIVVNLLSNAFKFTKEGSVTLNVSANHGDQTWSIAVKDTGIGIPPHALNLIFEEFRQVDGSYTRAFKGTGLGLAITRNLTRLLGGKILVESTLDVGSTFTVVLPMVPEEVTDIAAMTATPVLA